MIVQNKQALTNHKMFETREFVAIVPYQTKVDVYFELLSALVNILVLMVWLGGALLGMHRYVIYDVDQRSLATLFVVSHAAILGNSAGNVRSN